MSNIYYDPEDFGLTIVAEIDFADSYEFDKIVVWQDASGSLLWAQDSGCSCPTPFENHLGVESLERLSNWNYFEETVRGHYRFNSDGESFLREVESRI